MNEFDRLKPDFLAALSRGSVVVEAPTGSGKSTRLPIWCLERGAVLVVEPRRLACRALARHVAALTGTDVGARIGYAVRFDQAWREATEALFVTPGIALRWLAEGKLARFTTVIIDEFHERRWDTDLLAALLKRADEHRIVFTSATVEGERLAGWLGGERLQGGGRPHPVEVRYTEELEQPTLRGLESRIAAAVEAALKEEGDGDLLVFLPGRGEIAAAENALKGRVDAELIPLHAGVDNKVQDRALKPAGHRRVILATNVAETSLTIPGVTVVIDAGLERRTHHRNGRTVLALHPVSQAAADQRRGRAGRLGPGRCIRLWGRQARLEPFTPPEVAREELTELFLAAAAAGHPADGLDFPDPLPNHAVERALSRLHAMEAIDEKGLLNDHGRRLFPLPLDPLFAHLITAMPDGETRAAMVDLAAALSVNRRLLPEARREEEMKALKSWSPEPCDATTLIRLMRGDPPPPLPFDRAGAKEARAIAADTRAALGLPALSKDAPLPRQQLLEAVIRAAPELAFVRREKRRQALGNGESEVEIGRESRFEEGEDEKNQAEAAVVFDQHSIPARGTLKTLNLATCMAPVDLPTLARLGLGETEYGDTRWEEGRLFLEQRRIYAGRAIAHERLEPNGPAARHALARAILAGRLLKPAGEKIIEDIEAWNLWLALKMGEGESAEPPAWLETRLESLGVEIADDMELIEPEDIAFEGIPSWERAEFDERFPRVLRLENLWVAVHYDGRRKRLTLEYQKGVRRTDPMRKELPRWAGWKVFYRKGSREVEVR